MSTPKPAVSIDPTQAVAYGIGGWAARALRTGDFGRGSATGFALGAINDLVFQTVFGEVVQKQDKKNRKMMAIIAGASSAWLIDKMIVPETKKQITAQEAVIDNIVGNQVGDILIETIEPEEPVLP